MAPCRRCYAYGEIGALRRRSITACLFFTTTGALGSIWHLDGSQVTLTNPSKPGESLSLLAVGLGPTSPAIPTGTTAPTSPTAVTVNLPSITIDGQSASVEKAQLEPATIGKYRVFFTVPSGVTSGNLSLSLRVGGNTSNTVLLAVSRGSHQSSRSQMQAVSPAVLRLLRARSSASSESTSVNRISYTVSLDRLPRRVSDI